MSEITRKDLKAILLCAIHLAKVDNDFSLMEKKLLRRYADTIGLEESEREELVAMGGSLASDVDSLSSKGAMELLIKTLCAVSFVDGSTDPEEIEFIQKVLVRTGIDYPVPPKEDWGIYEEEVFKELKAIVA
jgi:uncharacterized tellurite resistance protein B-like protein